MNETPTKFWDAVDALRERDGRYRREAYGFVIAALDFALRQLPPARRDDPVRRHLTGQELLRGAVALARREFGAFAATVFYEWGLKSGEDVGRVVFQLVDARQLSARPEDSLDDFSGGPDLLKRLSESEPASARL